MAKYTLEWPLMYPFFSNRLDFGAFLQVLKEMWRTTQYRQQISYLPSETKHSADVLSYVSSM